MITPADIPTQNWKPGHRGVDLAAEPGAPVKASASGTIRFAGVVAGTPTVSVDHGDGLRTTYEPVLAHVAEGEIVESGTVIGILAHPDELPATARQDAGLHWGAIMTDSTGEHYLDPMSLVTRVRMRLWR